MTIFFKNVWNNWEVVRDLFLCEYLYRDLRAKKKRKRLLQEQQWAKEIEEKSDEKINEKVETDEENTMPGMDDESQGGDSSECKVGITYR